MILSLVSTFLPSKTPQKSMKSHDLGRWEHLSRAFQTWRILIHLFIGLLACVAAWHARVHVIRVNDEEDVITGLLWSLCLVVVVVVDDDDDGDDGAPLQSRN